MQKRCSAAAAAAAVRGAALRGRRPLECAGGALHTKRAQRDTVLFLSLCGALLLRGQITGRSCSGLPRTVRAGCKSFDSLRRCQHCTTRRYSLSTPFFARCAQPGKSKKPAAVIRCSSGAPIRAETGAKQSCGRLRRPRRLGRPRARLPPRLAAAAPALPSGSARLRRVTVSVPAAAASAAGARAGVLSKPAAPAPPRCLRPRCKPLIGCRGIASLVRPPARVSPPASISRGGKAAAYKILVLSNWLRQLPTKRNILYN